MLQPVSGPSLPSNASIDHATHPLRTAESTRCTRCNAHHHVIDSQSKESVRVQACIRLVALKQKSFKLEPAMDYTVRRPVRFFVEETLAMDHLTSYGIALIIAIVVAYGLSKSVRRKNLPPGPFAWPVVGNLFIGGEYPHQAFAQLAKRYGSIMSLYFGSVPVVIVSDANMARELFSVSDAKFASRPVHDLMYTTSKYMNFGDENVSMAISTYRPRVREARQLCMGELFTTQKLEAKKSTRAEEVHRTVMKFKEQAMNAEIVKIRPVVSEFSFRVSCRSIFEKAFVHSDRFASSESSLHPETFRRLEMEHTKLLGVRRISDVIPILRPVLGKLDLDGIDARWKEVNKLKENCTSSVLEYYREQANDFPAEESSIDFVETLLRLSESGKYTETSVKSLIVELLSAGADTVASTLEWTLLELVRHPHVMERLHAEIDAKFGMLRPVEGDEAAHLPYLQAVVKEVLRLHIPVTTGLPHCNMEDATLAGYHLPARTTVLANFWAMNRNTTTWGEDALMFNPDRFLDSEWSINRTNYQYLPFGAGRRICPGRALAMRVLAGAIGSFVHAFDWSTLPGVELTASEGTDGLNIRPSTPLLLQISPRPPVTLYSTPNVKHLIY